MVINSSSRLQLHGAIEASNFIESDLDPAHKAFNTRTSPVRLLSRPFSDEDAHLVVNTFDRRQHESGVSECVHKHADGRRVDLVAVQRLLGVSFAEEHRVAEDEPAWAETGDDLDGLAFLLIGKVVHGEVRDDDVHLAVVLWIEKLAIAELHVVDAAFGGLRAGLLQHPLADVAPDDVLGFPGESECNQARACSEVEYHVVGTWVGVVDDERGARIVLVVVLLVVVVRGYLREAIGELLKFLPHIYHVRPLRR